MADYFTHFSCLLDVRTPGNVMRALDIYNGAPGADADHPLSPGFLLSLPHEESGSQLWIHDDGSGDPDCVIEFVLLCAEEFDLEGLWGFEWTNTCSKPRLDAFGGGAHLINLDTRKSIGWVSTNEWLTIALRGDDPDA